jgi:preprotein translocase subunit YajC
VPEQLASLLPIIGIALLFWLLLIRPASRRQKELRRMQSSLDVGDEVMLTSGIYGRLVALEDDAIRVEIADGVTVKAARGAIGSVVPRTDRVDEDSDEADEAEGN